jgi:hypothetical protein
VGELPKYSFLMAPVIGLNICTTEALKLVKLVHDACHFSISYAANPINIYLYAPYLHFYCPSSLARSLEQGV